MDSIGKEYFEISAKDNIGVNKIFYPITSMWLQKQRPKECLPCIRNKLTHKNKNNKQDHSYFKINNHNNSNSSSNCTCSYIKLWTRCFAKCNHIQAN